MKVLLTICTLAALSCAAYAFQCYVCVGCSTVMSSQLDECAVGITQCKKTNIFGTVSRSCENNPNNGDDGCTSSVTTETCYCSGTDGCNSAGTVKASVMVSFLLACLVAKMLF